MSTTNSLPTPKQNRGNRRSGGVKGTPSGHRRGQLEWRKDPAILERINLVRTLKAQGYTANMMLGPVNELMRRRGIPEVTTETIYNDFARLKEIQAEERKATAKYEGDVIADHIEALNEIKRQAWRAFHSTPDKSLNRSAYLNTVRSTEETIAKVDGSMTAGYDERMLAVVEGQAEMVASVMRIVFGDPELGLTRVQVLAARRIAANALRTIDAEKAS